MAEVVKVRSIDVERARLLIKLNDSLGMPNSEGLRRLAAAKPARRNAKDPSEDS